ncbi:hypothetical protein MUK60_07510 [Streptomyces sp. LRE541]|uniref:hypothetical protein n=1 Tax=Streptomyces sp. LRE541 TaxID=2931983 RepID=UPI00200C770B|nr:hypothetical protein [Streptomyces sp. LRE541]UPZ27680.1 hypothetical protein MUK60_07510 [Streptomyces sp. LRE541]
MTTDLDRLLAAQATADELVALVADSLDLPGRRLLVTVTDLETNTRLATGFVAYEAVEPVPSPRPVRHLRAVS